jgi:hypothetical protein
LDINGVPVHAFERDSTGRLIFMPQVPVGKKIRVWISNTKKKKKKIAVAKIVQQISNWNDFSATKGAVTSSQGGFLIGPGVIRAPDVAFTPSSICSGLAHQQQFNFT